MHIHTTWAKIKWAFEGYYTLVLFIYFCGGGQVCSSNAHQLLAQARYQQPYPTEQP